MRRNEVNHFEPLPEERITIPSLGGDGVVLVRSMGFGSKIQMSIAESSARAAMILEACVCDEDGERLMDAQAWDVFGLRHPEDFLVLADASRRVSGFNLEDAKKNSETPQN
jgi:hypothetical protein